MTIPKDLKSPSLAILALVLALPLPALAAANVEFAVGDVQAVNAAGVARSLGKGRELSVAKLSAPLTAVSNCGLTMVPSSRYNRILNSALITSGSVASKTARSVAFSVCLRAVCER